MTIALFLAQLRFQRHRHGWPAVAGLVLLAAAIGVQLIGVARQRSQAQELRVGLPELRQRLAQRPKQPEAESGRLDAFLNGLPGASGALEAIDAIHRAAAIHGVTLSNGEYRLVQEGTARWLRYQITLPARAAYPQLRAWLADVMDAVPTAALDEITLRRDAVGSDAVQARVRLTLFLKAP